MLLVERQKTGFGESSSSNSLNKPLRATRQRPSLTTRMLLLNRGALYSSERTEDATVAFVGLEQCMAGFTFVVVLTSFGRHDLGFTVPAMRASESRF